MKLQLKVTIILQLNEARWQIKTILFVNFYAHSLVSVSKFILAAKSRKEKDLSFQIVKICYLKRFALESLL